MSKARKYCTKIRQGGPQNAINHDTLKPESLPDENVSFSKHGHKIRNPFPPCLHVFSTKRPRISLLQKMKYESCARREHDPPHQSYLFKKVEGHANGQIEIRESGEMRRRRKKTRELGKGRGCLN